MVCLRGDSFLGGKEGRLGVRRGAAYFCSIIADKSATEMGSFGGGVSGTILFVLSGALEIGSLGD